MNIQCIRNKTDDLYVFLQDLDFPGLVLITEHWLKINEPVYIPNYSVLSLYSRSNSYHGGTLILINNTMMNSLSFISINKFDDALVEKLFEFSIVYCSVIDMYIVCIYRSPLTDINLFLDKLETLLFKLPTKSTIVLAGDFNINFSDKESTDTISLTNLLTCYNLNMHVKSYTRVSQHSYSTIDYLCSNLENQNVSCSVISPGLSDHEAVYCSLQIDSNTYKCKQKLGRLYSRTNYNRFFQYCLESDWRSVFIRDDPFQAFYDYLTHAFSRAFPIQKIKIKNKKPWITIGIKIAAKNMRSLHYIRKYTNEAFFFNYYTKYRNTYRKVIKAAKEIYYNNRIEQANNKSKESWTIINELRGKDLRPTKTTINSNDLNNYYCSIADKLTENIIPLNDPLSYMMEINNNQVLHLYNTNIVELKGIIKDIKNKNSSGIDEISIKIFENLPEPALDVLVCLINKSFQSGVFPSFLKTSLVIPLYKGGDAENPSNYRPISLIPTLAKIIEKLIKKRVMEFLLSVNLLSDYQFGFQQNKSTNDAMFSFLNTVYTKLNEEEIAAAIFCDLSKAFDCVQHGILLQKLERYGFRGSTLEWFKSYLSGRKQIVKIPNKSDELNINCGVPQGSVLGPILFLLYINDLTTINITGKFTLFADDTTILWHCKEKNILEENICNDIKKIKVWCDSNLLSFNIGKTNIITFKCNLPDIPLGKHVLENKTCSKFLGLNIDCKLKFKEHITSLSSKLASGCYALRVVSNELGYSAAKAVYFSLIESHLSYGIAFWGVCSKLLMQQIFVLQKRAIRYLSKARARDSCKELFVTNRILTVISIFILNTVVLVHKYKNNVYATSTHSTRQVGNVILPTPRTTFVRDSVVYNGPKMYNHLPSHIRNIVSNRGFKVAVKNLLIDRPYYELKEYFDDTF